MKRIRNSFVHFGAAHLDAQYCNGFLYVLNVLAYFRIYLFICLFIVSLVNVNISIFKKITIAIKTVIISYYSI